MQTTISLLAEIEAFVAKHGMAESTFGREALGDWKLISELRRGRDLRMSTAKRIIDFMAEYTPAQPSERAA